MNIVMDNKYLLNGNHIFLSNFCKSKLVFSNNGISKITVSYTECGTNRTETKDHIIYSNTVFFREKIPPNDYAAISVKCTMRKMAKAKKKFPFKFMKTPKVKFHKST